MGTKRGKKRDKGTTQPTGDVEVVREEVLVELPSVPNFPYVSCDKEPPKNVVLILATESGYVLGHWDGVYYFDPTDCKIESVYGKVHSWCILLDTDSDAVFVDMEVE